MDVTTETYKELKNCYEEAIAKGDNTFIFPTTGKILLTSYAKYLLEYLQLHLDKGEIK